MYPHLNPFAYLNEDANASHRMGVAADSVIRHVHHTLKSKGYTHERIKQSAMEENRWTKGKHSISITGWHGSGKYGSGKQVHALYDSNHEGYKPVHEVKNFASNPDEKLEKMHSDLISKIHDHIAKVK